MFRKSLYRKSKHTLYIYVQKRFPKIGAFMI